MIRCPKCGTESPDQARFCRACGGALGAHDAAGGQQGVAGMSAEERARRLLEDAFRMSEEGRVLAAIQACQQAIRTNPTSTSAHSLLGTLYERQGDRDNAIREYEQVLALSPGSTVERRRLNELMGVPAAREAACVSPRTARFAVTGAAFVVLLVALAAIVLTLQQSPQPQPAQATPRPVRQAAVDRALSPPLEVVPSPGSLYTPAPRFAPRPAPPRPAAQRPRAADARPAWGGAQWVAPGTYMLPATGAQRPRGASRTAPAAPRGPFVGAVPVTGAQQPAVFTPGWAASPGAMPVRAMPSTQDARSYYFRGSYDRAIEAYEGYLATDPRAGAGAREELAWVYTEVGDRQRAVQNYRGALDAYRDDYQRGHNVEAARHGIRTCESALKALESR